MVCDEDGKELYRLKPGQRKGIKNHWVKWVPGDPHDVALVNRIFSMYADGSKGIKAICRTLNAEKIPSPKGGLWGSDTVHAILVNRTYIGERIYGGKWAKEGTPRTICQGAHDPIISKDLFDRVHTQMESRKFGGCNGMRTDYLLSGKIVCTRCGFKFQGRKTKNKEGRIYQYYIDAGFQNYKVCPSLSIPVHSTEGVTGIEDFVISEIQRMLDTDRYVERFKEYLKEALIGLERESERAYPALKKREAALRKEIESIVDELLQVKSEALRERLIKREAELERLKKEINKYESINSQPSNVLLLVNEYARVLKNVGEVLKRRSPGEQKTAIGYFLDRIEVMRDEGVARCYFYDTPRPREVDYLLPEDTGNRVCQDGAEGGT
ncbi:MAG: recombinase family protein [Nitrospirae bacterium]|nr:recombinase family protein [Nitrospirota bacterium]